MRPRGGGSASLLIVYLPYCTMIAEISSIDVPIQFRAYRFVSSIIYPFKRITTRFGYKFVYVHTTIICRS